MNTYIIMNGNLKKKVHTSEDVSKYILEHLSDFSEIKVFENGIEMYTKQYIRKTIDKTWESNAFRL